MAIASISPVTGELLRSFDALRAEEIDRKLDLAVSAFHANRRAPLADRAAKLTAAADILEAECDRFGRIMTMEMGKTLKSAVAEAQKCATACRYYADRGAEHLANDIIPTGASRSFVTYQPLGVVLAVMPWNFPFWQVFRFAAPALMAGNVGLLKHSSNVPQCALAIEETLLRAGFMEGSFQTLLVESSAVESLIRDDRIAAVTLTGSEPAGRAVASQAGSVVKKAVLELGGSDPFIVMSSANLEEAVPAAVRARTINNGQSCIAAKRFLVSESLYDEFERRFVQGMESLRVGDPMDPATDIGPLATAKIRDELDEQVERAVAAGAKVLTGGFKLPGQGNYYAPTVLVGVTRESRVFREEMFGPVAMLFRVRDVEEAVSVANDSPFGLGASVWTQNESEAQQLIEDVETGQVFVNAPVASDARLPFGGIKKSGYGRELSALGIREFVNAKTVFCK